MIEGKRVLPGKITWGTSPQDLKMSLTIRDAVSGMQVAVIKLTNDEFVALLEKNYHTPCVIEWTERFDRVGKKRLNRTELEELPDVVTDRDEMIALAIAKAKRKYVKQDAHFTCGGEHGSFTKNAKGVTVAEVHVQVWVDESQNKVSGESDEKSSSL